MDVYKGAVMPKPEGKYEIQVIHRRDQASKTKTPAISDISDVAKAVEYISRLRNANKTNEYFLYLDGVLVDESTLVIAPPKPVPILESVVDDNL